MERGQWNLKSIGEKLKKFKYPVLILLLGAVLLLWPAKSEPIPEDTVSEEAPIPLAAQQSLEAQMESILSCIEGAGKVRVLLTRKSGDETVYLTDTSQTLGADGASSVTSSAVRISVSGGGEAPVATQTIYGQYQGALIVCEGADRAAVQLELVNAVTGLTGLSADRVTVIKMKS